MKRSTCSILRMFTTCSVSIFVIMTAPRAAERHSGPPVIQVIYPRHNQAIRPVDSTFILGNVTPGSALAINGQRTEVHEDGGFLAFLPVHSGEFVFALRATNGFGQTDSQRVVTIAERAIVRSRDTAQILRFGFVPTMSRSIIPGDPVRLGFFGTKGMRAVAAIHPPGEPVMALVPLIEEPRSWWQTGGQPPYADTAKRSFELDSGFEDSLSVAASRYVGMWRVPATIPDTLAISYLLTPIGSDTVWQRSMISDSLADSSMEQETPGVDMLRLLRYGGDSLIVRDSSCALWQSPAVLCRWRDSLPVVVELTDSMQILRFGPRLGYMSTFQPAGIRMKLVGYEGEWSICEPASGYRTWIETAKTRRLPMGTWLPETSISSIRMESLQRATRIRFNTNQRVPFIVREEAEPPSLNLTIFSVTTNTDWILPDPDDEIVERITWWQREPGVFEAKILPVEDFIWGYETDFDGGELVLTIRSAPKRIGNLDGVIVCVDPGHSRDPGAVGPTGLREKDANLEISRYLRHELEDRGAMVVMTREDTSHVELYDRPAIARSHGADLFVSVHNNAVADGVDPRVRNGSATYYYHSRNLEFARMIHRKLLKATDLDDYGLNHGNFAVIRPTQYPAVLVECAFIIIPEQEKRLKTERFNKHIAEAIAEGIEEFVEKRGRR